MSNTMHVIEVGKEYPFHNRAKGQEECLLQANTSFVDLLYYLPKASNKDIVTFKSETIRYGFYFEDGIPFLLIDFPKSNWNFDVSFNVHKVQRPELDAWLENKEANALSLFLINGNTNKVEAMRMIGIELSIATEFKESCKQQLLGYQNQTQVDMKINAILDRLSTQEMIKQSKMIKL